MSQTRVSIFPDVADTTVRVHDAEQLNGRTVRPVAIRSGHATVQFFNPGDAYAWLEHCIQQLTEAV